MVLRLSYPQRGKVGLDRGLELVSEATQGVEDIHSKGDLTT